MADVSSAAQAGVTLRPLDRPTRWTGFKFLRRLFREKPLGAIGFVIIVLLLVAAAVATFMPGIIPYGYNEQNIANRLVGPSSQHWFGTDQFGRDVFSRVVYGARVSVTVSFAATLTGVGLATVLGVVSGYIGGWFDTVFQRLVDAIMSIPGLILLLVIVSYARPSLWTVIVALAISTTFHGIRIIRGSVIAVREALYIEGARVIGAGRARIMAVHILPNILPIAIVMITVDIGAAVVAEASLSFLGLGVPPPIPSWGSMISDRQYMFRGPWMSVWPGVALALTVYAWNVFGDAVRDLLDPRLRGSGRNG